MAENEGSVLSPEVMRLFASQFLGCGENKGVASSVAGEVGDVLDGGHCIGEAVFGECDSVLEEVMYSSDLRFTMKFAGELVDKLGCRDAAFFKHEAAVDEFRRSFLEFSTLLSEELEDVSEIIRRSRAYSNFSENWQSIIRRAAYYAFVIHFGAKRRGEVNDDGSMQDYVRHVMRTGFNHVIRKARIMDERELAVAILHDTREDWHEGFVWLLHQDESRLNAIYCPEELGDEKVRGGVKKDQKSIQSQKSEVVLDKMTEMEESLGAMLGKRRATDLGISELLCLLTKSPGENDRNRIILNMLHGILLYKDPAQREDAVVVLLLKICDRLDNLKSLMSSRDNTDTGITKLEQIKDETVLFFLGFAKEMGMQNVIDWLTDYLSVSDNRLRKRWTDMRRKADRAAPDGDRELSRDERLRSEFSKEFHELMAKEAGGESGELIEGRDYILEFRPIPYRHADFTRDEGLVESGSYSRDFRHYVIFYPVLNNPGIIDAGVNAFKTLFPDPLDESILARGELKCAFGQAILKRRKELIPLNEHGHSEKYGHGVYCFFESQEEAVSTLLGKWHMSRSYNCVESRKDVLGMMGRIEEEVAHLRRQYAVLDKMEAGIDELDTVVDVRESIRSGFLGILREYFAPRIRCLRSMENALYKSGGEDRQARIAQLRNVLGKLVMVLFKEKERKEVVVNGVSYVRDIPKGLTGMEVLPWVDVKLLGLPVGSIHHVADKILIEVSTDGFNQGLLDKQTGVGSVVEFRNVGEIAAHWKAELLMEELDE